jgi:hypothetical protein
MQIDLLHDIGDVGSCEGQVLESPCNALKLESLLNRRPGVYSELRRVVHGLQSAMVARLMMSSV